LSSLGALATTLAWCASSGRQTSGLPPCSSPRRPNGRVALVRSPPRPSRELQSKQKGNRGRIPSRGPAGPTASVIVSARDQKAAQALKPAEQNFWQIDHFGESLSLFSCALPRRREDRPEHPVRALSVPWQQLWPGAPRQGATLPVYLRVRVPASKWACCALSLSTCPPPGQVENCSRNKRTTVAGARRWVPQGQPPP
jgi:hypothetical protein